MHLTVARASLRAMSAMKHLAPTVVKSVAAKAGKPFGSALATSRAPMSATLKALDVAQPAQIEMKIDFRDEFGSLI